MKKIDRARVEAALDCIRKEADVVPRNSDFNRGYFAALNRAAVVIDRCLDAAPIPIPQEINQE